MNPLHALMHLLGHGQPAPMGPAHQQIQGSPMQVQGGNMPVQQAAGGQLGGGTITVPQAQPQAMAPQFNIPRQHQVIPQQPAQMNQQQMSQNAQIKLR